MCYANGDLIIPQPVDMYVCLGKIVEFEENVYLNAVSSKIYIIGPAIRCDEKDHFAVIWRVLGASQVIAAHRRSLLKNRSSVASQLRTMEYVSILLRFSSQRWYKEILNWELCVILHESSSNPHQNAETRLEIG